MRSHDFFGWVMKFLCWCTAQSVRGIEGSLWVSTLLLVDRNFIRFWCRVGTLLSRLYFRSPFLPFLPLWVCRVLRLQLRFWTCMVLCTWLWHEYPQFYNQTVYWWSSRSRLLLFWLHRFFHWLRPLHLFCQCWSGSRCWPIRYFRLVKRLRRRTIYLLSFFEHFLRG